MKQFIKLPKLQKGHQVAIISPSAGLPGLFPWVQDLGLERMRSVFGLKPIEYPTTRQMGSSLHDRARDIMAAFSDPENKAVFASIGGHDQIKLIKYLDPQIFIDNPKPFFGFSDNTHLQNFLWKLNIPSYYGGGVMNQFGMNVEMDEVTVKTLEHALFSKGAYKLDVSPLYNDIGLDWSHRDSLMQSRLYEENEGLFWDGSLNAEGILWGGCVESLVLQCSAGVYLPDNQELENTILFLETAEDIPEHWIVEYLLTGFGERGWFNLFKGVIVGRPKAWEFDKQNSKEFKAEYRKRQRETIVKTIREYSTDIPIVQNLDFGHTHPQVILPNGGAIKINTLEKNITLKY